MSVDVVEQMVEQQVRAWDVLDARILDAMRSVPRERFVPPAWRSIAYADCEIALPCGKRMLRPMIVGRLLDYLDVCAGEQVLEIGTGSGYVSACLASLGATVRSVELHEPIAELARANLAALPGATPVEVVTADAMTLSEQGIYDAIVVTASLPLYVTRFQEALRPGGRMFVVVGAAEPQEALLVRCTSKGEYVHEPLFETVLETLEHAPAPPLFHF